MKRVLIIDDSSYIRRMLGNIFRKNGFDVVGEAGDGESGVKLYKQLRPDIVTTDMIMPKMNGVAVLRAIRSFDPQASVFVSSSMGQEIIIREAIESGAKGFILKPFTEKNVVETVGVV